MQDVDFIDIQQLYQMVVGKHIKTQKPFYSYFL